MKILACKQLIISFALLFFVLSVNAQPFPPLPPYIVSFSPASGPLQSTVIITGVNFSPTPSNNIVYFGIIRAEVTAATTTSLTVIVPPCLSYHPMTITVNGQTTSSRNAFLATFPDGLKAFNPTSFGSKTDFDSGEAPVFVTVGDLDIDGKGDAVSVNKNANNISVFRNRSIQGIHDFQPRIEYAVGNNPLHAKIADLDGDGKRDIVVVNSGSNSLSLFRNANTSQGNIVLSARQDLNTVTSPTRITTADLDVDGKPELIVCSESANLVRIHPNTSSVGSLSFGTPIDLSPGTQPNMVTSGDLDGDGGEDLVITRLPNIITIYRNLYQPATITFIPKKDFTFNGGTPKDIVISDIDVDGRPDLVIVSNNTNQVTTWKGLGRGGIIDFGDIQNFSVGTEPNAVAIDDLNGDGKPEILTANFGAGTVSVLKNISSGMSPPIGFEPKKDYPAGNGTSAVFIADLESDGEPDILTANATANTISFLKNKANDPGIFSFNPTSGATGTVITLTGINFTGVSNVFFGGTPAASFTVVSDEQINATVANGATGAITINNSHGGYSKDGFTYIFPTSVFDPANNNSKELLISPNPGVNEIVITHPSRTKNAIIRFVDLQGKEIKSLLPARNSNKTYTNVRNLSSGIYYVLWSDGVKTLSRTFMVK